jgi:hypothetical protein
MNSIKSVSTTLSFVCHSGLAGSGEFFVAASRAQGGTLIRANGDANELELPRSAQDASSTERIRGMAAAFTPPAAGKPDNNSIVFLMLNLLTRRSDAPTDREGTTLHAIFWTGE